MGKEGETLMLSRPPDIRTLRFSHSIQRRSYTRARREKCELKDPSAIPCHIRELGWQPEVKGGAVLTKELPESVRMQPCSSLYCLAHLELASPGTRLRTDLREGS